MSSGAAPPKRIAIVGGGISGVATAYQLACDGVEYTLFEASDRLGGIVETVRSQGFVIECGPDSWVTEKPWARELAVELGLEDQIIASNDQWRRTYVQQGGDRLAQLVPIPDGMRMMVPPKWGPLLESPLFSWQARLAYLREPKRAAELKASAPGQDESVAAFVRRHFGEEVARTIAGPLLAAVFGGDITQLSVRAVMPAFVRMEAEEGSLIQAVQRRAQQSSQAIFTTLTSGLETLIERMVSRLPLRLFALARASTADREGSRKLEAGNRRSGEDRFDAVVLATPLHVTRRVAAAARKWRPHGRLVAPAGHLGHRGGASPSHPRKQRACASRAVLVLWFPRLSAAKAGPRTSCWPAPLCIRNFPAASPKGQCCCGPSSAATPPMRCWAKRTISSSSAHAYN